MVSSESSHREAVVSPQEGADRLGDCEKWTVDKGIDDHLLDNHKICIRGAKEGVLKAVEEVHLHADKTPEWYCKEKTVTDGH